MTSPSIEAVVVQADMPPGVLGPDPVTLDVRCYLVPTSDGIVLIDAGLPGASGAIDATLAGIGARWSDVTDIVLTHSHFDHVGGLAEAAARSPQATLWAGALDVAAVPVEGRAVRPVAEGDRIRGLQVLDTPGHTPGHISLLHEAGSLVVVGDLIGSVDGALSFGPPAFTADPERSRASLERVVGLGAGRLLFSHGAEVSDPNEMIVALLASSA
jgi:glyoxylase-like metal-dependent hydrolase (beta-lactamase superfamily II)